MTRLRRLCCALVCSLVLAGVLAADAIASHSQNVFFEAPGLLLNPATRQSTIAVLQRLGVNALRVELSWHTVAPQPNSSHRPAFDATDPAGYNWGRYDPLIEEAHRLGWEVLLTVTAPVPRWATANPRSGSLVTRPSSRQFEQFMTAVGRHYAGEVSLFAIWNEPNHHEFLEPQFNANGTPASPLIYRSLFQAGYAGLQAAGIVHPAVLIGETAPEGEAYASPPVRAGSAHNVAPLVFLRDALCLTSRYRRSGSCGALHPSGWAVHPYASAAGPLSVPWNPESVTLGSLGRITGALDLAARAGAIPAHLPVYMTEFGVMSKPNRYQGVPVAQQAEYDAISERAAYENRRVASFSQYLLRDDPVSAHHVSFQTGLEYVNGIPKPLFGGFSVPLTVSRRGHAYVLWGHVRPASSATTVTVEAERPGSRRFTTLSQVVTNSSGYWQLYSTISASRWRVRWTSPTGTRYLGPPIRAY